MFAVSCPKKKPVVSMKMLWKGVKVFITGIDGFVGSHLAKFFLEQEAHVFGLLHKPSTAEASGLCAWNIADRVTGYVGDLVDPERIKAVLQAARPQWIFHLGAQTIVTKAEDAVLQTLETNVRGTYILLYAAAVLSGLKGVVIASSDKAYGASPTLPYTEDMPLRPRAVYDSSKASAEAVARSVAERYSLNLAITRCANIYGSGDFHFSRIIPDTCRALLLGQRPTIRGDGLHARDFLYVDDAVAGYCKLAEYMVEQGSVRGEAFNFGTGEATLIRDLVQMLIAVGPDPAIEPLILGQPTPAEIPHQYVDATKARQCLEWRPRVSLAEGLQRTMHWYGKFFISEKHNAHA